MNEHLDDELVMILSMAVNMQPAELVEMLYSERSGVSAQHPTSPI